MERRRRGKVGRNYRLTNKKLIKSEKDGKKVNEIGENKDMKRSKNQEVTKTKQEDKIGKEDTKEQNKKETLKIGTWNVRSINGKEVELVEEFERAGLDVLGITETKKKGKGMEQLEGHIHIYSGVEQRERARAGVGCIIRKDIKEAIIDWTGHTERILTTTLEIKGKRITFIISYGPDEDEITKEKDKFWEELQMIYEAQEEPIYLIGDLNARVGKDNRRIENIMGKQGEICRNNNGTRLIDFCVVNNLAILNTMFAHKEIHKYTREMRSRGEKSIIDYILTNTSERKRVLDVRVKRGYEIGSDHYLVRATIKIKRKKEDQNTERKTDTRKNERAKEVIKIYKLREEKYQEEYELTVGKILGEIQEKDNKNIEELWHEFKNALYKAAQKVCGIKKMKSTRKQTRWWTQEIQQLVREKKRKWKKYIHSKKNEQYEEYKQIRKRVKEEIVKARRKTWEEFSETIQKNFKENSKLFYNVIKNQRKEKEPQLKQIKDKKGNILREEGQIMSRWQEYFEELLEVGRDRQERKELIEKEITAQGEQEEISRDEIKEAISRLKNGKAAGYDKIRPEQLKCLGETGITVLHQLLNMIWRQKKIPEDWRIAVILPIFKKGDKRMCGNYRGISLLSTVEKVYESIIERKIRTIVEERLEDSQSGFRKGHSVHDHIFSIRQVIEKTLKHDREAYICYLDLEKAFDRVKREYIWEVLGKKGISNNLIATIKDIYRNTKNLVRTGNAESGEFTTSKGLRQGGALSPTLFIILMDDIIKQTRTKTKKLEIGYRRLEKIAIAECAFADDLAIFARTETDLQRNLEVWSEELKKADMKINIEKTKFMVISKEERRARIQIDNKQIEQVESYKYLGNIIERKGNCEEEINTRIQAALKVYFAMRNIIINNKHITKRAKMTVYKTIYQPIILNGSETWNITKRQESQLTTMEMKYLRRVEGISKMDRIRNETIRGQLKIKPLKKKIEEKQLQWLGHMLRMKEEKPVRKIWEAKTEGKRHRGRPQKTWDNVIEDILKNKNLTLNQTRILAQNRKEWTKLTREHE